MKNIINTLWHLPRDLVSDGFDTALYSLAKILPMHIHEYPTGTECFTWIIPEKWTCQDARVETLNGELIFSHSMSPLHVVSYSLPFTGVVDRETLFAHLNTRPDKPDAIPFVFNYYKRDWGLCCSHTVKESMTDDYYRVVIDTNFSEGKLKVGEVVIKGQKPDCYIFCAHLCHPAQVNDDLSGVAVGMDVFRRLLGGPQPKYTYRLLLLPETIGSAAWLSHNLDLLPKIKGGLFLEMLGTPHPHALQHSNTPTSHMDATCSRITAEFDSGMWEDDFLKIILNDERMFNSPGIQVPMLSLSRAAKRDNIYVPPFEEYHTSFDTPDAVDWAHLEQSSGLVSSIIKALETKRVPIPQFRGELFCSRYNRIDYTAMFKTMNAVIYQLDGNHSVEDMAYTSGLPIEDIEQFIDILEAEGLVAME